MNLAKLEAIAQQLAARVREDDPDANQRWLHTQTTAAEREHLLYVLAAAVPDDKPWVELVAWIDGGATERRRRQWRESKRRAA